MTMTKTAFDTSSFRHPGEPDIEKLGRYSWVLMSGTDTVVASGVTGSLDSWELCTVLENEVRDALVAAASEGVSGVEPKFKELTFIGLQKGDLPDYFENYHVEYKEYPFCEMEYKLKGQRQAKASVEGAEEEIVLHVTRFRNETLHAIAAQKVNDAHEQKMSELKDALLEHYCGEHKGIGEKVYKKVMDNVGLNASADRIASEFAKAWDMACDLMDL